MCLCGRGCHDHTADICFYVPFCIVFVVLGVIQIISGIFYFITIPVIKLILNIAIGCWAVLTGIGGGMVACVCPSRPRKHEFLLYCSISILILNIINLIILEFGQVKDIFSEEIRKVWGKEYDLLESENARYLTTFTALISIVIAFVESQITFCLLNKSQIARKKSKCNRKNRRGQYVDNDQAADLEYVIPKKSESQHRKPTMDTTVQVYAKSWVFEGITEDEYHHTDDSSSVSICSSSPAHLNPANGNQKLQQQQQIQQQQQPQQPPTKSKNNRGRRTSRASDATSERFNQQMSSFSRCATPSPVPHSGQASPINGPTFHDYLEPSSFSACNGTTNGPIIKPKPNRLTVDYVASPPAPTPTIVKIIPKAPSTATTVVASTSNSNGPSSISSSQQDGSQFASLLAELEHTLMDKKLTTNKDLSPDNSSVTCSSKSSSKDLEFSKELEAALQLIQELETPSEGPLDQTPPGMKYCRSESEKTLSAAVSLPSPEAVPFSPLADGPLTPTQTQANGKHKRNIIMIETNSQSTSGYSSPNSFSSNSQSTNGKEFNFAKVIPPIKSNGTAEQIFTGDQSNIVRIYIEPNGRCTTHNSNSNSLLTKGHILSASNLMDSSDDNRPNDSVNKSFLLFKKRSKLMPQPDFQNRIFKSECLAYLSDEELVARHRCNREVIRKIEQNVAQKVRGSPRYNEAQI